MLREVSVTQVEHEPRRRWFVDDDLDLVVWLADHDAVVAIELCYDKPGHERALTWSRERGYGHFRVDAGDDTAMRNLTPILVSDGAFPKEQVVERFTAASQTLDAAIRAVVLERLQQFPS